MNSPFALDGQDDAWRMESDLAEALCETRLCDAETGRCVDEDDDAVAEAPVEGGGSASRVGREDAGRAASQHSSAPVAPAASAIRSTGVGILGSAGGHVVSSPLVCGAPSASARAADRRRRASLASTSAVAQVVNSIFNNVLSQIETSEVLAGLGELRVASSRPSQPVRPSATPLYKNHLISKERGRLMRGRAQGAREADEGGDFPQASSSTLLQQAPPPAPEPLAPSGSLPYTL